MSIFVMESIILLIKGFLATVLIAAGAAKFSDISGFTTTLIGLGMPARRRCLVRGLAFTVPLTEIGLGFFLIGDFFPLVVNTAVLLLMGVFSLVVLIALRKTPHVTCRCFGALSDLQFSWKGLARSIFLMVLAAVVVWEEKRYVPPAEMLLGPGVLLIVGYIIFAVGVAQAAKTIAMLKERIS